MKFISLIISDNVRRIKGGKEYISEVQVNVVTVLPAWQTFFPRVRCRRLRLILVTTREEF